MTNHESGFREIARVSVKIPATRSFSISDRLHVNTRAVGRWSGFSFKREEIPALERAIALSKDPTLDQRVDVANIEVRLGHLNIGASAGKVLFRLIIQRKILEIAILQGLEIDALERAIAEYKSTAASAAPVTEGAQQ